MNQTSLLDQLLDATWGGGVPGLIRALIDPERVSATLDNSTVGLRYRVDGAEAPRAMVRLDASSKSQRAALAARFPAAADALAAATADMVADTDGDDLRLLASAGAGQPWTALYLPGGVDGSLSAGPRPPADVPASIRERLDRLVAAGAVGLWMTHTRGGEVEAISWTTEQPWRRESNTIVEALGQGPLLARVRGLLAASHRTVNPYSVELHADGSTWVTIWGAKEQLHDEEDVVDIFADGATPSVEAFVASFSHALDEDHRGAAEALLRDGILPNRLARLEPKDERDGLLALWTWMADHLAHQPPRARLAALEDLGRIEALRETQAAAFGLAVARYGLTHPEATLPEGLVPARLADAAGEDLVAEARRRLEAFEALEAWATAYEPFVRVSGGDVLLENVRNHLEVAISGHFLAAAGPLHTLLIELGPTGYDHDSELAGLEDVDLESDLDAAIEEALADDDDL